MNSDGKPTEEQKQWLAGLFGPEVWRELTGKGEFREALDSSVSQCRRIALQYLAEKERVAEPYFRK